MCSMKNKKVIISVVNDLVTDQRVAKTADVLQNLGFEVLMVGRRKVDSPRMNERSYETIRMQLLWEKGPFFYIEFNIRLFFFLLFRKAHLLVSNDLDTLLPNFIIHKLRHIPIVYDSHEYFTETPELVNRPLVQGIWKRLEKLIVPRLKTCITVNMSIKKLFDDKYRVPFHVVRNIPAKPGFKITATRHELQLPVDKRIIILQGSGINIQRGAEEAVEAMQYIENALLLIVGGGDVINFLKELTVRLKLDNKVLFIGRVTPEKLAAYTCNADVGLSIDKDTNINYRYSLPNKLFDYLHAGIPVVASQLPEIQNIIEQYNVGVFINNHNPEHIAETIRNLLEDTEKYESLKKNTAKAANELNWETEKDILIKLFEPYAR